jgi:restriction system protein
MSDKTIWGIHAGKTGTADSLFMKKSFVALGWSEMGSIGKLPPNRDAFYAKVRSTYPNWANGKIINAGSKKRGRVEEKGSGVFS